jgi:hypothetical protein
LFRLDRFVEIVTSPEAWVHRLDEIGGPRAAEWVATPELLRIVLPERFECDGAWALAREFIDRAASVEIRRVVVDGRRLRYIDTSGLHFLKTVRQYVDGKPGAALTLSSFSMPALEILRQEGLGSIPVDATASE